MTTYVNQTFTGTNGATPGNLIGGLTPTGGSVLIQSNQARFTSGAAGGYNAADRVERAVSANGTAALSLSDLDMTLDFAPVSGTGEQFPHFAFRSPNTTWNGRTGYVVTMDYDRINLSYSVDWIGDPIGFTTDFNYNSAATYRILAVGSSLKVYINGTLKISVTDTRFSSGYTIIGTTGGGTAGQRGVMTIDNLVVKDPTVLTLSGTAASTSATTGAITKTSGSSIFSLAGTAASTSATTGAVTRVANPVSGGAQSTSATTGALRINQTAVTGITSHLGIPMAVRLGNGTPLNMRIVGSDSGIYGDGIYGAGVYGSGIYGD